MTPNKNTVLQTVFHLTGLFFSGIIIPVKNEKRQALKMTHAEKARDLFLEGYSCSQAVLGAYAEELGLDLNTAMKLSAPFGGGVGRLREMCGACSGMLMAFGMLYGYETPDNGKIKAAHYADTRELCENFRQRQGSYICREILGKRAEVGGDPSARTEEFYKTRPCVSCVIDAAEILDSYIKLHSEK